MELNETEKQVRKNIINFCKVLNPHLDQWKIHLKKSIKLVEGISNLSDQARHVAKADIRYIENFEEQREKLLQDIIHSLEEDLYEVHETIQNLTELNKIMKIKLATLENSTLQLNWENESQLINGSATLPGLNLLLELGLKFALFFQISLKNIKNCLSNIDIYDKVSLKAFENSFKVNLDQKVVTYLLCITQYVDKPNFFTEYN